MEEQSSAKMREAATAVRDALLRATQGKKDPWRTQLLRAVSVIDQTFELGGLKPVVDDGDPAAEAKDGTTNLNPTYFDALKARNERMENGILKRHAEELPDPQTMSHAHTTVHAGRVWMTFWNKDPVTKRMSFVRVTVPYDHFLLCARGLVDAHDDEAAMVIHEVMRELE